MRLTWLIVLASLLLLGLAADEPAPLVEYSEFHPDLRLLDRQGESVVQSGAPVSPLATCGPCHDVQYIAKHNYHSQAGLTELKREPGESGGRPWDRSPGLYGRWDPITNCLPLGGGTRTGIDTAAWERVLGFRHVGGGPAAVDLQPPVMLNCFLCHLVEPDNTARLAQLAAGRFDWAATATLQRTGLARWTGETWQWDASAIAADGTVTAAQLKLGPARSANCGLCHGLVYDGPEPLALSFSLRDWSTETTGQIFSLQRINISALNLRDKGTLARPWDMHAETMVGCTDCHHAPNDPSYRPATGANKPEHLSFDPRRLSLGLYLNQPDHDLAKGDSAQGWVEQAADGSVRRCVDCHAVEKSHGKWLPYVKRHLRILSCEACHIPWIYAPARAVTDWTMLTADGEPRVEYRGGASGLLTAAAARRPEQLLAGYQPVLLPRRDAAGRTQLLPYNLITSWFWVAAEGDSGDESAPGLPLSREQLSQALQPNGLYHPDILTALDADGDGALAESELRLDTSAKVAAVAQRLEASGIVKPRIVGEWAPFDLHHSVATGEWATRQCTVCHARDSRLTQPLELGNHIPPGVEPQLVAAASVFPAGQLRRPASGMLVYQPRSATARIYVLGHNRWLLGDRIGLLAVILVLLSAASHAIVRIAQHFKRGKQEGQ